MKKGQNEMRRGYLWVILGILLLTPVTHTARADDSDNDSGNECSTVKECNNDMSRVHREMRHTDDRIKSDTDEMNKLKAGALDNVPPYNQGNCDEACKPNQGNCSADVFKIVQQRVPGYDPNKSLLDNNGVTACEVIFKAFPHPRDEGVKPGCVTAVQACGRVQKQLKIQTLTNEITQLQTDKKNEKSEQHDISANLKDAEKRCPNCDAMSAWANAMRPQTPSVGQDIAMVASSLTPALMGGLNTWMYAKSLNTQAQMYSQGLNAYNSEYGNMLNTYATIGVPPPSPMMYGTGMGMGGLGFGGMGMGMPYGMGGFGSLPINGSFMPGMGGYGMPLGMGLGMGMGMPYGMGMPGLGLGLGMMPGMGMPGLGLGLGMMPGLGMPGMMPGMGGYGMGSPYGMGGMPMFTAGWGSPMYPYGTGFNSPLFPFGSAGGMMPGMGMPGMMPGMGGMPYGMGGMPGMGMPYGGMGPLGGPMGGYSPYGMPYGMGGPGSGFGYYNPYLSGLGGYGSPMLGALNSAQAQQDTMLAQQQVYAAQSRLYQTQMSAYPSMGNYGYGGMGMGFGGYGGFGIGASFY